MNRYTADGKYVFFFCFVSEAIYKERERKKSVIIDWCGWGESVSINIEKKMKFFRTGNGCVGEAWMILIFLFHVHKVFEVQLPIIIFNDFIYQILLANH